ncbi:unnamed protein product [Notodromas monacha]|uniref:Small ribosomal subunit protein eS1 n=1 Tax=Notodromas monacha TaxID=399045 RepID=A0A7R9BKS3_9CRUS|nr:unnamed protein product [Notodromas monacha]CAG0917306.1 unnamed protein product [Notodromas monacha]
MSSNKYHLKKLGVQIDPAQLYMVYREGEKYRQRRMPLRNFSPSVNCEKFAREFKKRHSPYLDRVANVRIEKLLRLVQEGMEDVDDFMNRIDEFRAKINAEFEVDSTKDLNKVSSDELRRHKELMEESFDRTAVRPGDRNFVYDKRVDFEKASTKKLKSDWDSDNSDVMEFPEEEDAVKSGDIFDCSDKMAVGKNKGLAKSGKKGAKKKIVDPFTRKDWYDVKAPSMFSARQIGKTLVNRTQGTKIASEGLKQRVFEVSLTDLQKDQDAERSFRKFKLIAEEVQGRHVLTNFHGMDLTTDRLRFMVKKWQTLIEANVDVKTTDGYLLRLFCIGFTHRAQNHVKKTCYAQHTQVKSIRRKMVEIMTKEVQNSDLKDVVNKLIPDSIAKDIEKACYGIYPLHDVYIRKVKCIRKPRFDLSKLLDLHGDGGLKAAGEAGAAGEGGVVVDRPDNYEPPIQEAV